MLKNIFAGIGVVLLVAIAVLASPALGKSHRAHHAGIRIAGHYDATDLWRPDTRSIA